MTGADAKPVRFVVTRTQKVDPDQVKDLPIWTKAGTRQLVLITCAGATERIYKGDGLYHYGYTKRLIVYAVPA